ncbi:MAG: putative rane protein [Solimicrobium sp.]|jgi:lipopolysaccharide export system permease protein|nr:putative rane protein [Solimicrobium sp.]
MIFKRALQRELLSTAGAVFTILFTIAITVKPVKILGMAANGQVNSDDIFILIGFTALGVLPLILVLTGYISVLMVISRSYQDSEMVVWSASGVSLSYWIPQILRFATPFCLITALLAFFVAPWANFHKSAYTDRFEQRSDISKISPGKFYASASNGRVVFVEGVAGDLSKIKNIFVTTAKNNNHSVVIAKDGETVMDKSGDKFLIMHQGRRYDVASDEGAFQLMKFDRYGVLIDTGEKKLMPDKEAESLTVSALWENQTPDNMAELLRRVSLPLMCLLLMLVAVPLGYVNPRSGRSANFLFALFLCVLYYNFVQVSQAWVAQSQFSFAFAWWPIHFLFLLLIVLLFSWRLKVNSRYHPAQLWIKLVRQVSPNKSRF